LIYDFSRKYLKSTFPIHNNTIYGIGFSPDGNSIFASGHGLPGDSSQYWISDIYSGRTIKQETFVNEVGFLLSPDWHRLATSSGGVLKARGEVTVWDAVNGTMLSTFSAGSGIHSVSFSQDGEWLAGVGLTGEAVVWRAASGQVVFRQSFSTPVTSTAFSPDDKVLAIGTESGTMYVTPWRTDLLIAAACRRLAANLTCDEWKDHFAGEKYHATCSALPVSDKCN
jgi:WD40 repeat protein